MAPKTQRRGAQGRGAARTGAGPVPVLSASEETRFRKLVEHSSDAIALLDSEGTILYASPAITQIAGWAVEEFVERRAFDFVHPDDLAACLEALSDVVTHPDAVRRLEYRARHKNGDWLTLEAIGVSRLDDPSVGAVVVNFRDITERKRMEDELRRSHELLESSEGQYRVLIAQAADAILVGDRAGNLIDANAAACELTGYTRDELLRLHIADTYPVEEREIALERQQWIAPGDRLLFERRLRRRDGSHLTVEVSVTRLADGRTQGTMRDITERKRQEEHLRWLTLATEQSPAAVIMTSPEGVIEYVNRGFTTMTGYAPEEVLGQTPRVLKSGLTPPEVYAHLWATIKEGRMWRGELCNRRKDGQLYWHSASIAPLRDAVGRVTHFVAVQQDITTRVAAEAAAHEREARLRSLTEANILGIAWWDASGVIREANEEYLRITGYTREDVTAGQVNFRTMSSPEQDAVVARNIERLAAGEAIPPWEKETIRKDGRRVPVVVGVAALKGRPTEGVVFLLDITERRALERQLEQAQKMEAVGRLAGGVAHDFNNILTAITGYADLLREDLPTGHPSLADVREIRTAADRAAALTRQLLAFSRQQLLETRVLDLNDLIGNLQKMLRRLLGEDVELVTALAPGLGSVRADAGQLEQVLMNLAVNSRDAMPQGGTLTIETRNAEVDQAYARTRTGLKPGCYVALAVRDTGSGMDPATKARVFEPFFTTKARGKGTGLGLSTVYGIVKQSDGYIEVDSEPGQGATFTVYLPRVNQAPEPLAAAEVAGARTAGTETILLAEDDAGVRAMVRETLVRYGYTVLEAPDGAQARRVAAGYAGTIDLVITDIVMPGLSGPDLATRLLAERPTLRVLFMSGYADDAVLRRGVLERGKAYLKKPFTPDLLLRKVRGVLEAAR